MSYVLGRFKIRPQLALMMEQAIEKLARQGSRALDEAGKCVYLAPDGKKCAVGHMLTRDVKTRETVCSNAEVQQNIQEQLPTPVLYYQELTALNSFQAYCHDYVLTGKDGESANPTNEEEFALLVLASWAEFKENNLDITENL